MTVFDTFGLSVVRSTMRLGADTLLKLPVLGLNASTPSRLRLSLLRVVQTIQRYSLLVSARKIMMVNPSNISYPTQKHQKSVEPFDVNTCGAVGAE